MIEEPKHRNTVPGQGDPRSTDTTKNRAWSKKNVSIIRRPADVRLVVEKDQGPWDEKRLAEHESPRRNEQTCISK